MPGVNILETCMSNTSTSIYATLIGFILLIIVILVIIGFQPKGYRDLSNFGKCTTLCLMLLTTTLVLVLLSYQIRTDYMNPHPTGVYIIQVFGDAKFTDVMTKYNIIEKIDTYTYRVTER